MGSEAPDVIDLGFLKPPQDRVPLEQYAHVVGECYLVPYPPENCWLGSLRVYRRAAPCEVLAEAEFTAGAWDRDMTRQQMRAAKREAGWCTVTAQRIMLRQENDRLGGGLFVKPPPDPTRPKITGTLSLVEPRSKI